MGKKLNILCMVLGVLSYAYLLFSVALDFDTKDNIVFATSAILFIFLGVAGIRNDAK